MSTTITAWGNSSGIRIPSGVLKSSRLAPGDRVECIVNASGNIEIISAEPRHRAVQAPRRTTAESLYARHPLAGAMRR